MEAPVCEVCGRGLLLSMKYDAELCPACDAWREPVCGDPPCRMCRHRPNVPNGARDLSAVDVWADPAPGGGDREVRR